MVTETVLVTTTNGAAILVVDAIMAIEVVGGYTEAPGLFVHLAGSPNAIRFYRESAKSAAVALSEKFVGLASSWMVAEEVWRKSLVKEEGLAL